MREVPLFFGTEPNRLFGVYHEPHQPPGRTPFVFCHPFGEEKLWAHRVFVNFARTLARAGRPVLRFDYRGSGDSSGEFRDSTLTSMQDDIGLAIGEVLRRTGGSRVSLLGLRLGASVASLVASHRRDVDELVMWAPIVSGSSYLQELLRINLGTQLAVYRQIREDRETLGRRLAAGGTVNVDGYDMGSAMADELDRLSLVDEPASQWCRGLIVQIDRVPDARRHSEFERLQARYATAECVVVQEEPFWKEIPKYYETAPSLFAVTERWSASGS